MKESRPLDRQIFKNNWKAIIVSLTFSLTLFLGGEGCLSNSFASDSTSALSQARLQIAEGNFYSGSRYAYAATQESQSPEVLGDGYALVTEGLIKAGLVQSSTYFFLKTLETKHKPSIRKVLVHVELLFERVGVDALREYLIRYTDYNDYDVLNRSAYLFSLGKAALLKDDQNKAIGYLNSVSPSSPLYPRALQLRGTALAIQNRTDEAIQDFKECEEASSLVIREKDSQTSRYQIEKAEAKDLSTRCLASRARTEYQAERFSKAEDLYSQIPKGSIVWTDILFEEAWNSFSKREFNRSLGKLVTYKSPLLNNLINSEIDILRAQGYLSLCLYDDTEKVLNEFQARYSDMGKSVKTFVEQNESNLPNFYNLGLQTLKSPKSSRNPLHQISNRFVRGPYFLSIVHADEEIKSEWASVTQLARYSNAPENAGMTAFLREVLKWREKSNKNLGGAFVRNSIIDHHSQIVSDFEKVSFIKIEMLTRAKEKLMRNTTISSAERDERSRGNILPVREDNQMFWLFNGEYWADELGDYVFGLKSECAIGAKE